MQGEDNYVITISNTEAEVIKKFVSIIDNATVSIDNDDVWDIMSAITYGSSGCPHWIVYTSFYEKYNLLLR